MRNTQAHTDTENQMLDLYRQIGDMTLVLESAKRVDAHAALQPALVGEYNQALAQARALLPMSKALHEDVGEASEATSVGEVWRALHSIIGPALHSSLPDDYAAL